MEQHIKILNSKTQTKLLCLVFANHPLHFQRAQLVHFFSNFNIFCTIGCAKWRTKKSFLKLRSNRAMYKNL